MFRTKQCLIICEKCPHNSSFFFLVSFYVVDFVREKQLMGILSVASHRK